MNETICLTDIFETLVDVTGGVKPVGVPFQEPFQLYDMDHDITESNNLIDQEIEVAEKLKKEFYKIKGHDPLSLHFKKD